MDRTRNLTKREEPSESAASETAQEHGKAACGCVQQCWDELFSQYRDALGGIDREQVIYDSGWEDCSGIEVRLLFTSGSASQMLRNWVRELMLRPAASPIEDGAGGS